MKTDTSGNPIIFEDFCPYCTLDTGGGHQPWCPCNPNSVYYELTEKGFEEVKRGRYKFYRSNPNNYQGGQDERII